MMFLISFAAACLTAVLSGMGVGGGGLLVLWLTFVSGWEIRAAQGMNLLFFSVSAASSLPLHLSRRSPDLREELLLLFSALPGVFLGCRLSAVLSGDILRRCFGWFLLAAGAFTLGRMIFSARKLHGYCSVSPLKNLGKRLDRAQKK